jgi:hypothetical protein
MIKRAFSLIGARQIQKSGPPLSHWKDRMNNFLLYSFLFSQLIVNMVLRSMVFHIHLGNGYIQQKELRTQSWVEFIGEEEFHAVSTYKNIVLHLQNFLKKLPLRMKTF